MLQLKIVSPEKVEYEGAVESVVVPGTMGQFEILNDHAPIISTLQKGEVEYATKEGKVSLSILGGFVEVQYQLSAPATVPVGRTVPHRAPGDEGMVSRQPAYTSHRGCGVHADRERCHRVGMAACCETLS